MRKYQAYEVRVYANGDIAWYKGERLHRDNGPAVVYPNGSQYYYQYGMKHREDGPAVIRSDGHMSWYLNGVFVSKESFDLEMSRKRNEESIKNIDVFGSV